MPTENKSLNREERIQHITQELNALFERYRFRLVAPIPAAFLPPGVVSAQAQIVVELLPDEPETPVEVG
jgi:hypothetical protein